MDMLQQIIENPEKTLCFAENHIWLIGIIIILGVINVVLVIKGIDCCLGYCKKKDE